MRLWLERAGIPHLLAIKSNEKLWAWTEKGPLQVRADRLAAQVEESGWYRHITLAMLAHAYLAVVRHYAAAPEWAGERGCPGSGDRLIPLTVPECAGCSPALYGRRSTLQTSCCPGPGGDDGIRPERGNVITNGGYHYWHQ